VFNRRAKSKTTVILNLPKHSWVPSLITLFLYFYTVFQTFSTRYGYGSRTRQYTPLKMRPAMVPKRRKQIKDNLENKNSVNYLFCYTSEFVRLIRNCNSNGFSKIRYLGETSIQFEVKNGLRQGVSYLF